jgi:hypothetical protein
MPLYTYRHQADLGSPVLIASLQGWVDAAGVGSAAAEHLAGDGPIVVEFDGDQLFDYARAGRSSTSSMDIFGASNGRTSWCIIGASVGATC